MAIAYRCAVSSDRRFLRDQARASRWAAEAARWAPPGSEGIPRRVRSGMFAPILVGVIQVVSTNIAAHDSSVPLFAYALLLIGPAALLLPRTYAYAVYAVTLAATGLYLSLDLPRGLFFVAALVALQRAVRRAPWPAIAVITGLAYGGYVAVTVLCGSILGVAVVAPSVAGYLAVAVIGLVAVMLAEANRIRSEHFREMARSAAEAARARQEQSRRQASDERLRIARELHDVLGHHLSLINVRAGVALHLLDTRPDEVRGALDAIKQASAEALREVRGVLATLNQGDQPAPRAPAHGLSDVDQLADEARAAGRPVTVIRHGIARPLPAELDRAAYRIVQEALTNVRRHAGPDATATVVIGYDPGKLSLRVEDSGVGVSTVDESGNGIPGMRERAAALGGSLTAGGRPEGGFRVEASLPIAETTAATTEGAA
jgi:signal transduction histidine kinase